MTDIDQFESVFRSAARSLFEPRAIEIKRLLLIIDHCVDDIASYKAQLQAYCTPLVDEEAIVVIGQDDYANEEDVLKHIAEQQPDLICTYRHLCSRSWRMPHGLGEYANILSLATDIPVLLLPHPKAELAEHALRNRDRVMVMTDHLHGEHRLVSWAAFMCADPSDLYLCNIEDEASYERFMEAIGKIPEIDTDLARTEILKRLLKDAADYIGSCQSVLSQSHAHIRAHSIVRSGRHLRDYKALVDEHTIDLLVMNAKDHEHMAMHGLVYPIAVAIRQIPLLLL